MAPELLDGAECSPATDVYSLGKTGLELLTGSRDLRVLASANCPEAFKALLRRMCAGESAKRPSMQEVAISLEEIRSSPAPLVAANSSEAGVASSAFLVGLAFVLMALLLVVLVVAMAES
jgi:serine/threonine protein kinase